MAISVVSEAAEVTIAATHSDGDPQVSARTAQYQLTPWNRHQAWNPGTAAFVSLAQQPFKRQNLRTIKGRILN